MNAYKRHMLQNARETHPTTIFDLMTRPISEWGMFPSAFGSEPSFKADLEDKGDHYELTADLPGVKKEDVKLSYADGVLTVQAESKNEKEGKDKSGYVFKERSFGSMSRSFALDDVDETKSEASFENGVLKLHLQKKEQSKAHVIAIK